MAAKATPSAGSAASRGNARGRNANDPTWPRVRNDRAVQQDAHWNGWGDPAGRGEEGEKRPSAKRANFGVIAGDDRHAGRRAEHGRDAAGHGRQRWLDDLGGPAQLDLLQGLQPQRGDVVLAHHALLDLQHELHDAQLLQVPAAPAGPAQPPLPLPWVVTGDVAYEGVPLLVTGDVTVAAGGALRLRGVDALVLSAPAHAPRITVQPGGTLELVDGAALLGGATRPTSLAALGSAFDLVVEPGGALRAKNATLQGARIELRSDAARLEASRVNLSAGPLRVTGGSPLIQGGLLEGSPGALVQVEAGALRVEGATLRDAGGTGAVVTGGQLHLLASEVREVDGYGLEVESASLVLEGTTLADSGDYGLRAVGATIVLRDNRFETHCGAYLIEGTAGLLEGNVFNATGHGLTLTSTGPVRVAGNTLRGASEALFVSSAAPEVTGNTFQDNVRGVVLRAADAVVEGNRFEGNHGALQVQRVDGPSRPLITGNAFKGSDDFGLQNELDEPVDARGNWWGAAGGPGAPGADAVLGPVQVEPWLEAPP